MCSIVTPEEEDNSGKQKMLNAKWIDRGGGDDVAVSPAAKCVRLLSNPAHVSGIKNEDMRSKHEAKALVERNDYATYTMDNVPPLPDYKVILPKGAHTTTSAQILTLESIMRHCVVSPAAVNCAKSSWGGRGSSRALT